MRKPLDEPLQAHVKGRGDIQRQKLREQKPARDRDPEGLACLAACAITKCNGQGREDRRHRGHHDRSEANQAGLDDSLLCRQIFFPLEGE